MFKQIGIANIFMSYCIISVDMNILYATRLMKLMTKALKIWVINIQLEGCVENCYWNAMFEVYSKLLEAYTIFEKSFHHLVCILPENPRHSDILAAVTIFIYLAFNLYD